MSGFLGFGGSDAKRANEGMAVEKNVFNWGLPKSKEMMKTSEATTDTGLDTMTQVKKYFTDIFSGSRTAQFAAAAPEINAINEKGDAARTAMSNLGTARGGGVAGAAQSAESTRMKSIDDALFGIRPAAATETAKIGEAEANVGLQQLSAALRTLGLSEEAIQHYISSAIEQRKASTGAWGNLLGFISSVAGAFKGRGGSGGSTLPAPDEPMSGEDFAELMRTAGG